MVKVLDQAGREVPTGKTGRIFVGNSVQFEGYTGGGTKEIIGVLVSVGQGRQITLCNFNLRWINAKLLNANVA